MTEFDWRSDRDLFNVLPDGILIVDREGVIVAANRRLREMFGYERGELPGRSVEELVPPERRDEHQEAFARYAESPESRSMSDSLDLHGCRADGSTLPIDVELAPLEGEYEGDVSYLVASVRDVRERRRREQRWRRELEHRALHDDLTGLANRRLFRDRLEHAVERARRRHTRFALAFLDLDHFKAVNDTHGHDVGDRVLERMARRLESETRDEDTLARIGGDEFTLVLEEIRSRSVLESILDRLEQRGCTPFEFEEATIRLALSIGVVWPPCSYVEEVSSDAILEHLLRAADRAMYSAKDLGSGTCEHVLVEEPPPLSQMG
jgi:diguanylate cyclase (GGDEF)-like protein/PAS domain S-box-containing protein